MTQYSIHNARVIDPDSGVDEIRSLHISGQHIVATGDAPEGFTADSEVDASGLIASPGLVDLYARLREPGFEKKATIATEAKAALYGGITTVICSPDTDPVVDEVATVELIHRRAVDAGFANVKPLAALTRQLNGEQLGEIATLCEAGCVGATNADNPISNTLVIRRLMEYARTFNIVLVFAPVDAWLATGNGAHEGSVATRLGIPAIPVAAETVALSMLIELATLTGASIHFSRLTSARGIELVRDAKNRGLPVTADTSISHLFFSEQGINDFNSAFKSVAPFRSEQDRQALRDSVLDGTLDAICSDHSPHEVDAKLVPFPTAAAGLSTLDTFLPQLLKFQQETQSELSALLRLVTSGPASVFGLDCGTLQAGAIADITLFDPTISRTVTHAGLLSMGKNTPCLGEEFQGQVTKMVIAGRLIDINRR